MSTSPLSLKNLNIRKDHQLWITVVEAKNIDASLSTGKDVSSYGVVKIDHTERTRTKIIPNTRAPFWNEASTYVLTDDFRSLEVIIWNDKNKSVPIGKVVVPRSCLLSDFHEHEEWYTIQPAQDETSVKGKLMLDVKYTVGDVNDILEIVVIQGSGFISKDANGLSDPYVVTHLLPDDELDTTQKTKTVKGSLDPIFNTKLCYVLPKEHDYKVLHFSVWDWDRFSNDEFMGQVSLFLDDCKVSEGSKQNWFMLRPATPKKKTDCTFGLKHAFSIHTYMTPTWCNICGRLLKGLIRQGMRCKGCSLDAHDKCLQYVPKNCKGHLIKKKKYEASRQKKLSGAQSYILSIQSILVEQFTERQSALRSVKPHLFELKLITHTSNCVFCSKMMIGCQAYRCSNCEVCCHKECRNKISDTCVTVGQLRLRYKYTEEYIMPIEYYEPLFDLLLFEKIYILSLLNNSTKQKEDVARTLVRCCVGKKQIIQLLKLLANWEICSTTDPNTIFRGNSLATKSFDAIMKMHGMAYLNSILKSHLDELFHSEKDMELDETRLEKSEDVEINAKNLTNFLNNLCNDIFDSCDSIPDIFNVLFSSISTFCQKSFPGNFIINYTSVAGFIFLRFFCPAILNPQLFGLYESLPTPKLSRKLTLVAKTLQSLSNLVDFGQKEAYMMPMNKFISSRMGDMKIFLDRVCTTGTQEVARPPIELDLNCDLANLYRYFLQVKDCMSDLHKEATESIKKSGSAPRESAQQRLEEFHTGKISSDEYKLAICRRPPYSIKPSTHSPDLTSRNSRSSISAVLWKNVDIMDHLGSELNVMSIEDEVQKKRFQSFNIELSLQDLAEITEEVTLTSQRISHDISDATNKDIIVKLIEPLLTIGLQHIAMTDRLNGQLSYGKKSELGKMATELDEQIVLIVSDTKNLMAQPVDSPKYATMVYILTLSLKKVGSLVSKTLEIATHLAASSSVPVPQLS